MIVKAVQEHSVQQMTLWDFRRVLERHEMTMVGGHAEAELADRLFSVCQQALSERGVGPRLGDDAGPMPLRTHPPLLGDMGSFSR